MREVYIKDDDNLNRFVLGDAGHSPLLCIGVNPSTATPETPDPTIRSVKRIAAYNGNDGWLMVNLYPQRATDPNDVDICPDEALVNRNILEIKSILSEYDIREIWAAWGNLIDMRKYYIDCLKGIYSIASSYKWVTFGGVTKSGNPRHPLYLKTSAEKQAFDIKEYIDIRSK